jgi:hypothetical protein
MNTIEYSVAYLMKEIQTGITPKRVGKKPTFVNGKRVTPASILISEKMRPYKTFTKKDAMNETGLADSSVRYTLALLMQSGILIDKKVKNSKGHNLYTFVEHPE